MFVPIVCARVVGRLNAAGRQPGGFDLRAFLTIAEATQQPEMGVFTGGLEDVCLALDARLSRKQRRLLD